MFNLILLGICLPFFSLGFARNKPHQDKENDQLILHYSFDQPDMVVIDETGNENSGMIRGATFSPEGLNAWAIQFDGVSDHLEIQNTSDMEFNVHSGFSICVWVNQRKFAKFPNGSSTIFRKDNGIKGLVVLEINYRVPNTIRFHYGTRPLNTPQLNVDLVFTNQLSMDNEWFFICAVRDASMTRRGYDASGRRVGDTRLNIK